MKDCMHCKHYGFYKGAYTGTIYYECELKREHAENLTMEEMLDVIKHPEKQPCIYENGKPVDMGVTYDD